MSYDGNDLNQGLDVPRQKDAASCQSYCKSNYPTATHFDWVSPSNSWGAGHNTCWCKTSNAGRKVVQGTSAGEVICYVN